MTMRRTEEQHNTREQVAGYLAGALELLEAADVPEDLRVAYFGKAADLLAAKQITFEQVAFGGNALPLGLRA